MGYYKMPTLPNGSKFQIVVNPKEMELKIFFNQTKKESNYPFYHMVLRGIIEGKNHYWASALLVDHGILMENSDSEYHKKSWDTIFMNNEGFIDMDATDKEIKRFWKRIEKNGPKVLLRLKP